MNKNILEFSVVIDGKLEKFNDVLSKARARVFYKEFNRNGGYITDEFAEKLLSTIPYVPVKGIYSSADGDYTDHGQSRDLGRIYGIVPAEPNVTWEDHLDEDGVVRTYATVDVLLFTAIYKEAEEIINKSLSMELYRPTLKGRWEIIDGVQCFKYEEGCFLGLQILGDEIEPCFEGAAFFSLYDELTNAIDKLQEFSSNFQKDDIGGKEMPSFNFKLSDSEKQCLIWDALNVNYNEEGGWTVEYSILDVFDEYVIVRNYAESKYERVEYTKDDENNTVTLGEKEEIFFEAVTADEKASLETLRKLNNNSLNVEEVFSERDTLLTEKTNFESTISTLEEKNSEFEQKIEEKDVEISTLTTERDEVQGQLTESQAAVQSLTEENEELKNFKSNVEETEKQKVLDKYSENLDKEVIDTYQAKIAEYTKESLEKELAFELVQSKPSLFSINKNDDGYVPKDKPLEGVAGILAKYKK